MQDDDRPVLGVERASARSSMSRSATIAGDVGAASGSMGVSSTSIAAPPPPERVDAGMDEQSVEPGVEPVRVA